MTDTQPGPESDSGGFLTDEMTAYLTGELASQEQESVRANLFESLHKTFAELREIWHYLSDEDLDQFFRAADEAETRNIRGSTEAIISLLYLGGQFGGDDLSYRIESAISAAEAAQGRRANVHLDIRTSEMLTPSETIEQLEQDNEMAVSYAEWEQLWMAEEISVDRIAEVEAKSDPENTAEELAAALREERAATTHIARIPTPTVTDIERVDESSKDGSDDNSTPDIE